MHFEEIRCPFGDAFGEALNAPLGRSDIGYAALSQFVLKLFVRDQNVDNALPFNCGPFDM